MRSSYQLLRKEIASDYDSLDAMHEMYSWIPNSACVRPSADGLLKKNSTIADILDRYVSLSDYIMDVVFHAPLSQDPFSGKQISLASTNHRAVMSSDCVFAPNEFPYGLEKGHHYILWYPPGKHPITRDEISEEIMRALKRICNDKDFDFCWYENPKMTIPEIFHVQVFWIYLDDIA